MILSLGWKLPGTPPLMAEFASTATRVSPEGSDWSVLSTPGALSSAHLHGTCDQPGRSQGRRPHFCSWPPTRQGCLPTGPAATPHSTTFPGSQNSPASLSSSNQWRGPVGSTRTEMVIIMWTTRTSGVCYPLVDGKLVDGKLMCDGSSEFSRKRLEAHFQLAVDRTPLGMIYLS